MPSRLAHPTLAQPRPPARRRPVDILLVHYTGMPTGAEALERLCDAAGPGQRPLPGGGGRDGLLPGAGGPAGVACRAPATGRGSATSTAGRSGWNWSTLGMNGVTGHFPMPRWPHSPHWPVAIMDRHGILPHRVLAHSDVAPSRKEDPGELFDWRGLAAQGIGFWPSPCAQDDGPGHAVAEAQALLARFGYEVEPTGVLDPQTRVAATAFQRHFIPDRVGYGLDAAFMRVLRAAVQAGRGLKLRQTVLLTDSDASERHSSPHIEIPLQSCCNAPWQSLSSAPPDGRMTASQGVTYGRGKSGLHGNTVPGNARRGRP